MEYINRLLRKSGGKKSEPPGQPFPTPEKRGFAEENEYYGSQQSTPKKNLDYDTESDTTADYESAGEASPWEKPSNVSALADYLAGVHLSTPDKIHHNKLTSFPFSPISAEDECDEEVTAIISNGSQSSSHTLSFHEGEISLTGGHGATSGVGDNSFTDLDEFENSAPCKRHSEANIDSLEFIKSDDGTANDAAALSRKEEFVVDYDDCGREKESANITKNISINNSVDQHCQIAIEKMILETNVHHLDVQNLSSAAYEDVVVSSMANNSFRQNNGNDSLPGESSLHSDKEYLLNSSRNKSPVLDSSHITNYVANTKQKIDNIFCSKKEVVTSSIAGTKQQIDNIFKRKSPVSELACNTVTKVIDSIKENISRSGSPSSPQKETLVERKESPIAMTKKKIDALFTGAKSISTKFGDSSKNVTVQEVSSCSESKSKTVESCSVSNDSSKNVIVENKEVSTESDCIVKEKEVLNIAKQQIDKIFESFSPSKVKSSEAETSKKIIHGDGNGHTKDHDIINKDIQTQMSMNEKKSPTKQDFVDRTSEMVREECAHGVINFETFEAIEDTEFLIDETVNPAKIIDVLNTISLMSPAVVQPFEALLDDEDISMDDMYIICKDNMGDAKISSSVVTSCQRSIESEAVRNESHFDLVQSTSKQSTMSRPSDHQEKETLSASGSSGDVNASKKQNFGGSDHQDIASMNEVSRVIKGPSSPIMSAISPIRTPQKEKPSFGENKSVDIDQKVNDVQVIAAQVNAKPSSKNQSPFKPEHESIKNNSSISEDNKVEKIDRRSTTAVDEVHTDKSLLPLSTLNPLVKEVLQTSEEVLDEMRIDMKKEIEVKPVVGMECGNNHSLPQTSVFIETARNEESNIVLNAIDNDVLNTSEVASATSHNFPEPPKSDLGRLQQSVVVNELSFRMVSENQDSNHHVPNILPMKEESLETSTKVNDKTIGEQNSVKLTVDQAAMNQVQLSSSVSPILTETSVTTVTLIEDQSSKLNNNVQTSSQEIEAETSHLILHTVDSLVIEEQEKSRNMSPENIEVKSDCHSLPPSSTNKSDINSTDDESVSVISEPELENSLKSDGDLKEQKIKGIPTHKAYDYSIPIHIESSPIKVHCVSASFESGSNETAVNITTSEKSTTETINQFVIGNQEARNMSPENIEVKSDHLSLSPSSTNKSGINSTDDDSSLTVVTEPEQESSLEDDVHLKEQEIKFVSTESAINIDSSSNKTHCDSGSVESNSNDASALSTTPEVVQVKDTNLQNDAATSSSNIGNEEELNLGYDPTKYDPIELAPLGEIPLDFEKLCPKPKITIEELRRKFYPDSTEPYPELRVISPESVINQIDLMDGIIFLDHSNDPYYHALQEIKTKYLEEKSQFVGSSSDTSEEDGCPQPSDAEPIDDPAYRAQIMKHVRKKRNYRTLSELLAEAFDNEGSSIDNNNAPLLPVPAFARPGEVYPPPDLEIIPTPKSLSPIESPFEPGVYYRLPVKDSSTSVENAPSTSAENAPSTSSENAPSTSAQNAPRTTPQNVLSTSDVKVPCTSAENAPRTSLQNALSTSAENAPRTSPQNTPSTSAENAPRTSLQNAPSTSAENAPRTSLQNALSTSAQNAPRTSPQNTLSSSDVKVPCTSAENAQRISAQNALITSDVKVPCTSAENAPRTSPQNALSTSAENAPRTSSQNNLSTSAQNAQRISAQNTLSTSDVKAQSTSAQNAQRIFAQNTLSTSDVKAQSTSAQNVQSSSPRNAPKTSAEIGMEPNVKPSLMRSKIVENEMILKQSSEHQSSHETSLLLQGEMNTTRNEKFSYNFNNMTAKDSRASPIHKSSEELKLCGLSDSFKMFKLDDLSTTTVERKSYEDLMDRCLEQERLLGFDESIKEEADKLIKEIANASSESDTSQSNDFLSLGVNSSEAGPVTADEDLNKGELFQDANLFDFDYLSKLGKGKPGRRLVRESLFLKFDPLATSAAATPEPAEMAQADSSSEATATPPRAPQLSNGEDKLVSITPYDDSVSSPASSTVATPPRGKPRPASASATPTLRQEMLSKEISKLQDLMLRQECSYQEQIAACTEEVELLREKVAELEARENQENLQEKLTATEAEITKLRREVADTNDSKKQLMMIMEEYEKTISQVVTMREDDKKKFEIEKEQIGNERDEAVQHLRNMEIAFNDVHHKYEKCKEVIEAFKHNEEQYKISLNENRKTIMQQEENYRKLKEHAAQKLEQANIEIAEMKKAHQAELAKMVAVQRKMEIQVKSLEESLEQKKREAAELTKICDDLITKVEQ